MKTRLLVVLFLPVYAAAPLSDVSTGDQGDTAIHEHNAHDDGPEVESKERLRLLFKTIDVNRDEIMDAKELIGVCLANNIDIEEAEAERAVTLPDKTVGLTMDMFVELLAHCPSSKTEDILFFLLNGDLKNRRGRFIGIPFGDNFQQWQTIILNRFFRGMDRAIDAVCTADAVNLDACFCKNNERVQEVGEVCSAGMGCNYDGTCLTVCASDSVNLDACFCVNVQGGKACTAGQGCSSDGICHNVCTEDAISEDSCFCDNGFLGDVCTAGQGCNSYGCFDVCSVGAVNMDACFCQNGQGGGQDCNAKQGCTSDGACLDVCTADAVNYDACFCKNAQGGGKDCTAGQGCNSAGTCLNACKADEKISGSACLCQGTSCDIGGICTGGNTCTPGKSDRLQKGHKLNQDESLRSENGIYDLVMQSDGNLVIYRGRAATYSTGTSGAGSSYLEFQEDGNLVILYKENGTEVWATDILSQSADSLVMQNDGDLVLYAADTELWTSNDGEQHCSCNGFIDENKKGECQNEWPNDSNQFWCYVKKGSCLDDVDWQNTGNYWSYQACIDIPTLLQAQDMEEKLTSSEIKTIDSILVDKIAPGVSENPENVKRVEAILKESDFEYLFPQRDPLYTYHNFLQAIGKFPAICDTYKERDSDLICKKTLTTMFAHITQETGGRNPGTDIEEWRQGLVWLREMGCNEESAGCGYNGECVPGWIFEAWPCGKNPDGSWKKYFGRGAKQISYNYNYGRFSDAIFGTVRTLLDEPSLVANTWLNLASATWFFVYPQPPTPSMLFVLDGTWQPNKEDKKNNLEAGFGATIMIINGGIECGNGNETPQAINRINYYKKFSEYFKVDIEGEQLSCAHMKQFKNGWSGALDIYWAQNWQQWYQCKLVNYTTSYTALKKGDYAKCVEDKFDVILL